jgi:flagellar biosynthesis/type III secretory pathway M-ring protein FliF/YscJ
MRVTFRQLLYFLLVIGFITLCFITCSKEVFVPILKDEPAQEELLIQKTQEGKIKDSISSLLNTLFGKKTFFISINVHLKEKFEETEAFNYTPKTVSKNYALTQESNRDQPGLSLDNKVKVNKENTDSFLLPGLVSQADMLGKDFEDLPGFPVISPLIPTWATLLDDDEGQMRSIKQKEEHMRDLKSDVIYYNQMLIKTTTPNTSIDRMYISVVIDQDRFSLVNIKIIELEDLIKNISGFNSIRGDNLLITFLPFPKKTLDIQGFLLKHKKNIDKFKGFFSRFRWVFIGLLIAILICLTLVGCFYGLGAFLRYRSKKKKEYLRQLKEEQSQIQQEKSNELEEKRDAILNLARTNPEEFAHLVVNWIEKSS